jgi:hypothetical protein
MTHPEDDAAYLLLIDRHIEELKQRLDDLRELIVDMVARDEDTASQSELLYTLLQAIESMKAVKARELDALLNGHQDQARLPKQAP